MFQYFVYVEKVYERYKIKSYTQNGCYSSISVYNYINKISAYKLDISMLILNLLLFC